VYVAWLGSGVSGIRPEEVRRTVGPVWALLPLARQVAQALGPWLAALLAARQGRGLAALSAEDEQEVAEVFAEETRLRPFERQEAWRSDAWLGWLLVGELRRLAQLAEAPEATMRRPGWLAWEVRYWALAVSLVRIGQVYGALEQREGVEAAQGIFKGALARVWRQAVQTERAA
jgi:hypothetical protein